MATAVLTDVTIWLGEYDATGHTNQVSLVADAAELDSTTFGDAGWRSMRCGLQDVAFNARMWNSYTEDEIDDVAFANLGASDIPIAVTLDGTEGDTAYFFQSAESNVQDGLEIGQLAEKIITAVNSDGAPLVRGSLTTSKQTVSSSGTGTGAQLGAVSATQSLYSLLVVFASTGSPTLDVVIQSDDNAGFSSPTTQITHTQMTGAGFKWATQAGAISDDYFRSSYTFGGTGTINFAVLIGVGPT